MKKGQEELIDEKIKLLDEVAIWDQRDLEWKKGWVKSHKRINTEKLISAVEFNDIITTFDSVPFFCEPYSKFTLLIDLAVANTPTDIVIKVLFSDNGAQWYQYMQAPFGDLRYEDSAGAKMEAVPGDLRCTYVKLRATATGTTAANTFTLTAKLICET